MKFSKRKARLFLAWWDCQPTEWRLGIPKYAYEFVWHLRELLKEGK